MRGGRQKKGWVVGAGDANYKTLECEGQHMTKHNTSDAIAPHFPGCTQDWDPQGQGVIRPQMATPARAYLEYLLWCCPCYFFNVHASFRTAHHYWALSGPVHHNSKISLPRDVQCFCNHNLVHLDPLPCGLLGLEFVAKHLSSERLNGVQTVGGWVGWACVGPWGWG